MLSDGWMHKANPICLELRAHQNSKYLTLDKNEMYHKVAKIPFRNLIFIFIFSFLQLFNARIHLAVI